MSKYLVMMLTVLLVYSCGNIEQEENLNKISAKDITAVSENQADYLSEEISDNITSSNIDDISIDELIISTSNIQLVNKYGLKPITEDMVKDIKYADVPQLPTIPASHD